MIRTLFTNPQLCYGFAAANELGSAHDDAADSRFSVNNVHLEHQVFGKCYMRQVYVSSLMIFRHLLRDTGLAPLRYPVCTQTLLWLTMHRHSAALHERHYAFIDLDSLV